MPRRLRLFLAAALAAFAATAAGPGDAGELGFEDVDYIKLEFMIMRGQVHEAIAEANRMLAGARPTEDQVILHQVGRVLIRLCDAHAELRQYGQAEAACLEAAATLDQLSDLGGLEIEGQAEAQAMLAYTYERAGKPRAAIDARRRQIALTENGPETANYRSSLLVRIGDLQSAIGERKLAELTYREAVDLTSQIPESDRWTGLAAYRSLAAFYQREERLDEAEAVLDWGLVTAQRLPNAREWQIIRFFEALGGTFFQQGRHADARDVAQQALDYYQREREDSSLKAADATILMARIEDAEAPGSPEAARLLSAVLEMPDDEDDLGYGYVTRAVAGVALAEHHLLNGAFVEAEPLAREAAEALASGLGNTHLTASAHRILARALRAQGRLDEAVAVAQTTHAVEQLALPPYHSAIGETLALLVELYDALGQRENLAATQKLLDLHRAERVKFESAR